MKVCLSPEADRELQLFKKLDRELGIALEACIEMLAIDANEFEGHEGFSIKRVAGLFRRGIRLYRVKYEKYIAGVRILFFSVARKNCVFVTGIHSRGDLSKGTDYNFSLEPFMRSMKYWTVRETLC